MQESPISIRPSKELLAKIDAIARAAKPFRISRHNAIITALEEFAARHAVAEQPKAKAKANKKKTHE